MLEAAGAAVVGTTRGRSATCRSRILGGPLALRHLDLNSLAAVRGFLEEVRPDAVYHLSGQSRPEKASADPLATFRSNTEVVWVLLEALRAVVPHSAVTVLSTIELAEAARRTPYFASKACAELVCASFADTYRLRVAIAQCSHVYGPDENQDRLVTSIVADTLAGRPVHVKDPAREFDLLFVEDVAAGLLAVEPEPEAAGLRRYRLSTGSTVTGREVAELVAKLVAGDDAALWQGGAVAASRRPADRPAGWRPVVPLADGLLRTIGWHRRASSLGGQDARV